MNAAALQKKRKLDTCQEIEEKSDECRQWFEPHCFLQCHDSSYDQEDFSQQVWCCKFKPDSNDIVATCGSESVCLIDANSAKVKARYTKPGEEFYTLDWSRMSTAGFISHVLSCGGTLGFVYLIHVEQFYVYGFFKAHSKPVQTMAFVPGNSSLLFTAGNERKIFLWDIGPLSLPDYHFSHKKLAAFDNLQFSPLKMLCFRNEYLFCASEGGLFCWYTDSVCMPKSKNTKFQRFGDVTEVKFLFVDDEPVVDGLVQLEDDLLATKCAQSGVIFLWKPSLVLPKIKFGNTEVVASVTKELKWSNTEQFYINITACRKTKTIFAGDEKGSVWIYDCGQCKMERVSSPKVSKQRTSLLSGKPQTPNEIVQWPICRRNNSNVIASLDNGTVLNDICCSENMKFVVVAADNNLVCIYRRSM